MQKNSHAFFLIITILMLFVTFGSRSHHEPDELSYVMLLGIDHGTENLLRVSYLIAVPKAMGGSGPGGGGGGQEKISTVVTIESSSLYASMNMVNTFVGRKISLMHVKGIVFSESMARDGSMGSYVPGMLQFRETRGTAFIAVSRQKPEEILEEMHPLLEENSAKYMELLATTQNYTGFIPEQKLQDFYNELKMVGANPVSILVAKSNNKLPDHPGSGKYRSPGDYLAGQLDKKGGVALETMGAAVFRNTEMVGMLNGDEVIIYSMFRGQYRRSIFSFQDPKKAGNIIAMEVSQGRKPKINIELIDNKPIINVKITLEGNVLGLTSLIDYSLPQNRPVLEKAFEQYIQKEAERLVEKTKKEFRSDILGFGMKARRLVLTDEVWNKLNWPGLYEQAEVHIQVDFKVRRTGTMLKIMPVPKKGRESVEGEIQ